VAWKYAVLADRRDIDRLYWGARHAADYMRGTVEEGCQNPSDKLASTIVHGEIDAAERR